MICKKCDADKSGSDFYSGDSTCKPCRREMVRVNRASKADYYRQYDKDRYQSDPKVKERHLRYVKTDAGREAAARAKIKYKELNPIKRGVHVITGNAIKSGRLKRMPCEICGTESNIHAHHDDYARPLDVRWLCAQHHDDWHKENGEGENGS